MYRIAKTKVDVNQLEYYQVALKEADECCHKTRASGTVEADKKDAAIITIFEVYANLEAYQSHIATPHFKKHKETVKDMVLSLELIDTELVARIQQKNIN